MSAITARHARQRIAGDRRYLSEGFMAKLYEVSKNEDLDAIHSAE